MPVVVYNIYYIGITFGGGGGGGGGGEFLAGGGGEGGGEEKKFASAAIATAPIIIFRLTSNIQYICYEYCASFKPKKHKNRLSTF